MGAALSSEAGRWVGRKPSNPPHYSSSACTIQGLSFWEMSPSASRSAASLAFSCWSWWMRCSMVGDAPLPEDGRRAASRETSFGRNKKHAGGHTFSKRWFKASEDSSFSALPSSDVVAEARGSRVSCYACISCRGHGPPFGNLPHKSDGFPSAAEMDGISC